MMPGASKQSVLADGGIIVGASRARPARHAATGLRRPGLSRQGACVLVDRIAAIVMQHEPGWRLPRLTALARRCNVSPHEAGKAVDELIARHLVRRLPDGQIYRSSPAEYLTALEGITGLGTHVDPMGGELHCGRSRMSWRPVPAEVSCALKIPPDEPVCVLQLLWTSDGEPAATSTTYLVAHLAERCMPANELAATADRRNWPLAPLTAPAGDEQWAPRSACRPGAVSVEMQPPPPSAAKKLRLAAGQPALLLTVRFDDACLARPGAITVATLRPDMFRIVLRSTEPPC